MNALCAAHVLLQGTTQTQQHQQQQHQAEPMQMQPHEALYHQQQHRPHEPSPQQFQHPSWSNKPILQVCFEHQALCVCVLSRERRDSESVCAVFEQLKARHTKEPTTACDVTIVCLLSVSPACNVSVCYHCDLAAGDWQGGLHRRSSG